MRRSLGQVQGNHIVTAQSTANHFFAGQLIILVIQAEKAVTGTQFLPFDLDAGCLQGGSGTLQIFAGDFQRGTGTADLNGRIIRIQIG